MSDCPLSLDYAEALIRKGEKNAAGTIMDGRPVDLTLLYRMCAEAHEIMV